MLRLHLLYIIDAVVDGLVASFTILVPLLGTCCFNNTVSLKEFRMDPRDWRRIPSEVWRRNLFEDMKYGSSDMELRISRCQAVLSAMAIGTLQAFQHGKYPLEDGRVISLQHAQTPVPVFYPENQNARQNNIRNKRQNNGNGAYKNRLHFSDIVLDFNGPFDMYSGMYYTGGTGMMNSAYSNQMNMGNGSFI